jgi:hypothetical protein
LARRWTCRRRHIGKLKSEALQSVKPIINGSALILRQCNLLFELQQVRLRFEYLCLTGAFRTVEAAFSACHPVRALIEKVVGAVSVAEIVEPPWLTLGSRAADDRVPIDKDSDGAHIASEVTGIRICFLRVEWG